MRIPLIAGVARVRGDALIQSIAFSILVGLAAPLAGVGPANLFAQNPPVTNSGLAIVKGVIADSLNGGYVREAIIAVSGTPRIAVSDSLGRFRIDGLQPGSRRIDVFHSRLDELGIALLTPSLDLRAGDSTTVRLAFPSAKTVVGMLCRATDGAAGPAAVFGQVLDADHQAPIRGARLSLEWIEYTIEKKRIKTSFEQRSAVTAADGHFGFCGLPADLTASLSASFGGDTTAKVGIRVDPMLAARTLYLAAAHEASTATAASPTAPVAGSSTKGVARRTATLNGKVVSAKGVAISRARVAVDRLDAVALTDGNGRFALSGIRPGTRTLNVRRLGFEPVEIPVDVIADNPKDITVRLADFVPTLDTVVVTAMLRDRGLDRVGFSRRKKSGMGTYLTPEQIQNLHAIRFVDLFKSVPMLRQEFVQGRTRLVGRPRGWGAACVDFFVDDVAWAPPPDLGDRERADDVEDFIHPSEVGAIEVYSGAFAPGQFVRGLSSCGTAVVIWTKPKLGIR